MNTKARKFLEFLVQVLNKTFETDSFELVDDIVQIYSKQLKIAVLNLMNDPLKEEELSMVELFRLMKDFFVKVQERKDLKIDRLVILSTTEEDDLVTDFIEFQRQKNNIRFDIEFWGWKTIEEFFESYKSFLPEQLVELEVGQFVNYVPTANVYQLFGYEEILAKIDRTIDENILPVVVHNPLHGTGRTAIALAYAFHYTYQKKFDHIAYVEVVQDLMLDFTLAFDHYAAFEYNPSFDLETNFENLLDRLSRISGRNLLIIDGIFNAEQVSVCFTIAKKLKWKILITSKFRLFTFNNIFLDHPTDIEAAKIFKYYAKDSVLEDIKQVLDNVSNHPFSLVFLGKSYAHFIREGHSQQEFLDILEQNKARSVRFEQYLDKSMSKNQVALQQTVLKYIMAFFDYQIKQLTALERRILLISSVLPSQLVTFTQLRLFVPYGREDEFQDTVLSLLSKGWLEADKGRFRVPSYIRMVLHKRLKPTPNKLKRYLRLLTEKMKQGTVQSLKWLNFAQAFIKSVVVVTPEVANLALYVAQMFDAIGLEKKAIDYYEYTAYVFEEVVNEYIDEDLLEIIAEIFYRIGKYDKALFYAQQLFELRDSMQEQDEKLADTYVLLSKIYAAKKDFDSALYNLNYAKSIYKKFLSPNDKKFKEIEEYSRWLSQQLQENTDKIHKKQWFRRFLDN